MDENSYFSPGHLNAVRDSVVDTNGVRTAVNSAELVDLMQQMLNDAEKDRRSAKRESYKNTAILVLTALGVIIAGIGVILTVVL